MQQGDLVKNEDYWLWLQILQSCVRFFGIASGGRNSFGKQGLEAYYIQLSTPYVILEKILLYTVRYFANNFDDSTS